MILLEGNVLYSEENQSLEQVFKLYSNNHT